jgi:hypothetical protein
MPVIDEDILRELMHRATDDLHAPAGVSAGIVSRHRRRNRNARALSVAVAGVAAGTAVGVAAAASGVAHPNPRTATPAIRLTAAQQVLYRLSAAAAAVPQQAGRYVELGEVQGNAGGGISQDFKRVSVIDGRTGDVWTYQQGRGVPSELPVDRHGSPTAAEFASWPTAPAALRALLITQARQQQATAARDQAKMMAEKMRAEPRSARLRLRKEVAAAQPKESDDDLVFLQATDWLWNPLVSPALRAALYKVLAATPGVVVKTDARDSAGRPAIEISRADSATSDGVATFEDRATGGVLESLFTYPADKSTGAAGSTGSDLYLSLTRHATLPANPYGGS